MLLKAYGVEFTIQEIETPVYIQKQISKYACFFSVLMT